MKTAENIQVNSGSGTNAKKAFFSKPGVSTHVQAKPAPFFNSSKNLQAQGETNGLNSSNETVATEEPKVFTKPKSFWVLENDKSSQRHGAFYAAETVTMEQLTHAIYKNPLAMLDTFSNANGKTTTQEIPAYTRIKIPMNNAKATGWALNGYRSPLIFRGISRNPFPILAAMGVSSTTEFALKKTAIETELKIEKTLMSMYIRWGKEDEFIKLLKKYAQRNFTEFPDKFTGGGQYVDKIFVYLRGDIKKIGYFDQMTSAYDLIFNHFKRANEVRQIRDFHSKWFKGDDGIREISYSDVFLEEAFEKALTAAGVPKADIMSFLNKAGDAIADIISEPKKFLRNLIGAVKSGFNQFVGALPSYLGPGLLEWVLGKIGAQGVDMPKDFSVKSILKLALQSLQITPTHLKNMVYEIVGPENVAKATKVWGIVSTFMKGGIAGLANQLIEYVGDLKITLVNKLKTWVLKDLVKSAVSELLKMFIPGGGLIKVIEKIYDIIQFVRSKLSDLKDLFATVGQSVLQIVKGDISTAAAKINESLKGGLYLLIDLLARLMKINFMDGIKNAIQNLREKIVGGIKKLVEKIVIGGKDAIGNVKAKLNEWWHLKKGFRTKSGQEHQLYFVNKGKDPVLFVASTPKSFASFIDQIKVDSKNKKLSQNKKEALQIALELNKIIYRRADKNAKDQDRNLFYEKKRSDIQNLLNNLSTPLAALMESQIVPKGTHDDPIPIRWSKRGMVLTMRDLIPNDRKWAKSKILPPDPIEEAAYNSRTKLEIPPSTRSKFPGESEYSRNGQKARYIMIGISASNIPSIGKKIKRSNQKRKDSVKNRFRYLLSENYNYNMGAYDMDHILDLGFDGKDSIDNLWPLYREMNQRFGNQVYHQVVSYSDEKGNTKIQQVRQLRGKWFIIESIGD